MAKVKLTTCLAGAVVYNPGDTYECSDGEAVRLI